MHTMSDHASRWAVTSEDSGVQEARSSISIDPGRSESVPKLSDRTRVAVPPAAR
ncbi:hypothetical protein AHiyo4_20350 [Arthrobacter sp. Hiyo4]|nr:hypothetical protein AHiyo4_20350 [Arthrobacter sp. Hiyo4]